VRFAQTIESAGNDLLLLINDILDISKIEAGRLELSPDRVRIARLLRKLDEHFQPIAAQKGLRFRTELAEDAPPDLTTDPQRLEQILKNLLSNAVKFTERGEVVLRVQPAGQDGAVAFSVQDTGIGIAPEQQQAIFEAFRQADGTISRKYGGTGLGLSISRELVRLLGGEILVESEPDRGSTFTVLLPAAYDPSQAAPQEHGGGLPANVV
jgi:signal transduction histidine kinase